MRLDASNETDEIPSVTQMNELVNNGKALAKSPLSNEPVLGTVRRNVQSGLQSARKSIEQGLEDANRNLTEGYKSARRGINSGIEDGRRNIVEGVESARRNIVSGLETARVGINAGLISAQESLGERSAESASGRTVTIPAEFTDEKSEMPDHEAPPSYETLEETTAQLESRVADRGLVNLDWRSGTGGQESGILPESEK